MKSLVILLAVLFHLPFAMASKDIQTLGCVYAHDENGWHPWQLFGSGDPLDLQYGEQRFVSALWTSEKPTLPNYAVCISMTGTTEDDAIVVENYRYKAAEFDTPTGYENCQFTGKSVELMSKEKAYVKRGTYSTLEIDWLPPEADKIQIRQYLPTLEESAVLGKIAQAKCEEIAPKN